MQRARVSNREVTRERCVKVQREVVQLWKPYLPLEDAYSVLLQKLLYTNFKCGAEKPELWEYPPEDSSKEDRASYGSRLAHAHGIHSATGYFWTTYFEWETGSAAGICSPSIQQPRAGSGFDMSLTILKIQTWTFWLKIELKSFTSKRFAQRDLKTAIHLHFFWETKQLCAKVESFCIHKGTEDGVDEVEKESEWYYKYCLVRQGWLKTTFINIMERLEETEDSHDSHAIADGGRSAPLPGSTLPPPFERGELIRHKSCSSSPFSFCPFFSDQWRIHKQAWRGSRIRDFTLKPDVFPYKQMFTSCSAPLLPWFERPSGCFGVLAD